MNRTLKTFVCFLLLVCVCPYLYPQDAKSYITIEGQVIDADVNLPLAGATIVIKGSNLGTATDVDGNFKLRIPKDSESFTVSFIGKESATIKIREKGGRYKIMLKDDAAKMEDVVVTGYRTISKTRMTGAAESITSEKIENKGFSSVGDILRGELPGVRARLKSGKLGEQPEIVFVG